MDEARFDGCAVAVSGAAQGLGAAVARMLIARGARVYGGDLDARALAATAAALGEAFVPAPLDVTEEDSILAWRDSVIARSGGIDALVTCAGIYPFEGTREITVAGWDRMFNVNCRGTFLTVRAFMDDLAGSRQGRVVMIASTDSYIPKPLYPHYAASKAAVRSLVQTFALEMAPGGTLVNGVSPGAIAVERAHRDGWLDRCIPRIPLGRVAEPDDIAEVVAFLASAANRFMTGETVVASGGEVMA
jgi:3-oxoacyl-[acyl-carrier protein] reductase